MERIDGVLNYHGIPYSGHFIDYYYNGRIEGEGTLLKGKVNGHRKMYYQNGKVSVEREYKENIRNGFEIEYYEDGSMKQKGEFVNCKENGIWDMYYPNGQLKQRSNFINGEIDGESTVYYSTGKILAVEITKNGKTIPDKRLEKINQAMKKGRENYKEDDFKGAIKYYTKAIELDSNYAEAYFARGTIKLDDMQFDQAIADFDKALILEPFMSHALANRAFARLRKYQLGGSRTILKNSEVTVLASKDKVSIPDDEQALICNDLHQAVFLGEKSKLVMDAISENCKPKSNQ